MTRWRSIDEADARQMDGRPVLCAVPAAVPENGLVPRLGRWSVEASCFVDLHEQPEAQLCVVFFAPITGLAELNEAAP